MQAGSVEANGGGRPADRSALTVLPAGILLRCKGWRVRLLHVSQLWVLPLAVCQRTAPTCLPVAASAPSGGGSAMHCDGRLCDAAARLADGPQPSGAEVRVEAGPPWLATTVLAPFRGTSAVVHRAHRRGFQVPAVCMRRLRFPWRPAPTRISRCRFGPVMCRPAVSVPPLRHRGGLRVQAPWGAAAADVFHGDVACGIPSHCCGCNCRRATRVRSGRTPHAVCRTAWPSGV